jgi:hypothetical protein
MNTASETKKTPVWYWVAAVVLLLWNLMGVLNFFQHLNMTEEELLAMPPNERHLYEDTPVWVMLAFALAVFAGLGGSIALLLKRKWATALFTVSLFGIIVQMGQSVAAAMRMDAEGLGWVAFMTGLLILTAILSIRLSRFATAKGWMR